MCEGISLAQKLLLVTNIRFQYAKEADKSVVMKEGSISVENGGTYD